jgi:hypothetical protein
MNILSEGHHCRPGTRTGHSALCTSTVQQRVHFLRWFEVRSITFSGKAMTDTLPNQTDCCDRVVSEVKGYNLDPETDHQKTLFVFFLSPSMQILGWLKGFIWSGMEGSLFDGSRFQHKGARILSKCQESPNNIVFYLRRNESSNTSVETSNFARPFPFISL